VRVWITGVTGQLGREILSEFVKSNVDCIPVDRLQWDMAKQPRLGYQLVKNSMPDLVINAAAYTQVDKAESEFDKAMAINAEAVGSLADACGELGIPFVHISTDYVFDGKSTKQYSELDVVNPINVYGQTKLIGEKFARSSKKHLIFRVSWLFSHNGNNFVNRVIQMTQNNEQIRIVDDQFGCPTSCIFAARAIKKIAFLIVKGGASSWGIFHLANSPSTTWFGFAREIVKKAKIDGSLDAVPMLTACSSGEYETLAQRPRNSTLNTEKIYKVFGIMSEPWKTYL
jgi:dTDP-4-dehydrorhamnose reductase